MRIVYGINPVMEALKSADRVEKIIVSDMKGNKAAEEIMNAAKVKGIRVERLPSQELERLSNTPKHQGAIAVIYGEFRYSDIDEIIGAWKESGKPAFILILDSIQDPQNLGSLVRTANAAGMHGVIIPKDRACEVTPAVVKASAGATEHTLIAQEVNITRAIERLKEEGVWVASVEADCKEEIYRADLDRDLAIVIGSEGKGIRRLVRESSDFCVSIPMAGDINSLNAAQAGAVAIFEARRQRLYPKK